ncbi:hypothetical protein ALC60_02160 [Trachymyrmex zeteki]|uniref:Uncharacterized protein n=1 Tax=Mycetomoellerius zeteki TaxID=64791 RepID=A0A151XER2_9HYME|nr:hypothetical protein ALC60_02160 [Trachymyrmex zeteki]
MLLQLESISSAFNAFEAIQTSSSVAKEGEGMEIDSSGNYIWLFVQIVSLPSNHILGLPTSPSSAFRDAIVVPVVRQGTIPLLSTIALARLVDLMISRCKIRWARGDVVRPVLRDTSRPSFVSVKQPSFPSKRRQFLPRSRPRHSTLLARYSHPTSGARERTLARHAHTHDARTHARTDTRERPCIYFAYIRHGFEHGHTEHNLGESINDRRCEREEKE